MRNRPWLGACCNQLPSSAGSLRLKLLLLLRMAPHPRAVLLSPGEDLRWVCLSSALLHQGRVT